MNAPNTLDELIDGLRSGTVSRRAFIRRACGLGLTGAMATALAREAAAQGATPGAATPAASPAAGGAATRSITREEYLAQMKSFYEFIEPGNSGGQVIYVNSSDIGTLNPIIRIDVNALFVIANLFNNLVTQSPVDGSIVPDLADYWETSADGLTYTFHLNKNATWHDGKPVTADDVIFSFAAAMDETGQSPYRADLVASLASTRAIDEHTVELVATRRLAVFLYKTALNISIVPKHIWESTPVANWGASPAATGTDPAQVIGSGPFRFVEWVQGDHATIERNDDYWVPEQTATIDQFIYRVVADQNSAVQSLKAGESDISGLSSSQVESVESNDNLVVKSYDTFGWQMFIPNQDPERGTFGKDKRVRQALMYALDRQLIVDQILNGYGVKADGMQPVITRAYMPDKLTTIYGYDPDKAKALLDEAGWVDTDGDGIREKDGVKFSTEFPFDSGDAQTAQIVTYIQEAWKEIGVDIQPSAIVQSALIEQVLGGDFQLALMGVTWSDEDQGILYRSDAFPEAGGFNVPRYSNPEFDKLNDAQLIEFDDARRMDLIAQANDILNEDVASGLLYFARGVAGFSSALHNFVPNAYGAWWLAPYLWVEPR